MKYNVIVSTHLPTKSITKYQSSNDYRFSKKQKGSIICRRIRPFWESIKPHTIETPLPTPGINISGYRNNKCLTLQVLDLLEINRMADLSTPGGVSLFRGIRVCATVSGCILVNIMGWGVVEFCSGIHYVVLMICFLFDGVEMVHVKICSPLI